LRCVDFRGPSGKSRRSKHPQAASGCERVLDEFGAHVIGDRPSGDRREQQSITVARYRFPPVANGRQVMSPTYFVFNAAAVKSRPSRSGIF
jgi:hypothetical protein